MTPHRIITTEPIEGFSRRFDWKPYIGIILAIVAMILAGFNSYNNNDKAIASRISSIETQQTNDYRRLDRIENKVDEVLRELRQRSQ